MSNVVPGLMQPNFRPEGVQKTVDRYNGDINAIIQSCEKRFTAHREEWRAQSAARVNPTKTDEGTTGLERSLSCA